MPRSKKGRPKARWVVLSLCLLALVGGAVAFGDPDEFEQSSPHACGAATAQTIAAVDARVAHRIYRGETAGREVHEDLARIAGAAGLIGAVRSDSPIAARAAVHALVYAPHWHIVRLRAIRHGRVLADVGGPYIIAPVTGTLREHGTKVGSFVTSVQDDVGYVKLVTRFVGVPIDLYREGRPLMGTLSPAPRLPSDGTLLEADGKSYLVRVQRANAFPNGTLSVALLVPTPTHAQTEESCAAARDAAWGAIVEHVAARYKPLPPRYQALVGTLAGSTGGLAYVRVGATQVAGLNAGPKRLPMHGSVRYRRRTWQVFSWSPDPPARIYFLAPS